jgi:hypothetical protein
VLEHYGDSCAECGETDPKKLRIIFADPEMRFWRKKHDLVSANAFYQYLHRRGFPKKFKEQGKYKLIALCKNHYKIFDSDRQNGIPRSEEVKRKISKSSSVYKKGKFNNPAWLKRQHEIMIIQEIADLCDVSYRTILRRMIKFNIHRRNPGKSP